MHLPQMIAPDDPDLPDEIREGRAAPKNPDDALAQYNRLRDLGRLVAGKRDAAVKARVTSGVEAIWTACEEAYAAIDDVNRTNGEGQQWRKPTSPSGPLTRETSRADEARSTVFVRLTTRYVDMGAAKIKERALPIGDAPFEIKPTPVPDQVETAQHPQTKSAPNPASTQPAQMTSVADAAAQLSGPAKAASKAQDRIWDWLVESKYPRQMRRAIDDGARLGTGVLKGPFPENRRNRAVSVKDGAVVLEIEETMQPGCTWVDPWNFFPSPNCGEDVHDGDFVVERSYMSEAKLLGLKSMGEPGGLSVYLGDQIDKVVDEGPDKCNYDAEGTRRPDPDKKGMYQVWNFTGQLKRQDMIDLGAIGASEMPTELMQCHAVVTLINDTIIRAQFNPLEKSGHFPYRVFNWSRRTGSWAGVGVAEQVIVPQRMVNAGTRAWLNNAGVSSGVQLVFDSTMLRPVDGSLVIGGGVKLWELAEESTGTDVRSLMAAIAIPNLGEELKAIIDYAFRLAEEMSNIPLISQGQTGPTDPETFGQAELQNSNANALLRQIADTLDEQIIEPMIGDYYEWLLLDPDVPDEDKGDFDIVASGCSALVEKAIQENTLLSLGQMTLNPAFELKPARWAQEYIRTKRLDPERIRYTDDELKQMRSQPPMPAPAVQVAQINAQAKLHVQDMADQAGLQRIQAEMSQEMQAMQTGGTTPHAAAAMARVAQARIHAESAERVEASRAYAEDARAQKELEIARENGWFKLKEMEMQREIQLLTYVNQRNVTLMQAKSELAQTAMIENTKRQLAGLSQAADAATGHMDRHHDMAKHVTGLNADAAQAQLDREHEMALSQQAPPQAETAAPPMDTAA